jgi:hypothetical protein
MLIDQALISKRTRPKHTTLIENYKAKTRTYKFQQFNKRHEFEYCSSDAISYDKTNWYKEVQIIFFLGGFKKGKIL